MKEQLQVLLMLQKIDIEINKEDNRKKRLPDQIRKKEEAIANLEKKYQITKEIKQAEEQGDEKQISELLSQYNDLLKKE